MACLGLLGPTEYRIFKHFKVGIICEMARISQFTYVLIRQLSVPYFTIKRRTLFSFVSYRYRILQSNGRQKRGGMSERTVLLSYGNTIKSTIIDGSARTVPKLFF